jgi:TfoX/Sxy family transcriptional regulator of competence genes
MAATKKTAVKRRTTKSSASPRTFDLAAARQFAAAKLPGAEVNGKFGGASFFVDGKVFAFTRPKGLVLKLPQDVLAKVLATREAQYLTMGKRVMREWVLLAQESPERYVDELPLLRSAMDFVRSLEKKKK